MDLNVNLVPGLRVIELILEIVLQAMKDQPPEVRQQLAELALKDILWWRKLLKID